jgi:hypothetical protein
MAGMRSETARFDVGQRSALLRENDRKRNSPEVCLTSDNAPRCCREARGLRYFSAAELLPCCIAPREQPGGLSDVGQRSALLQGNNEVEMLFWCGTFSLLH